jgi:hypothetical protein
MSEPSIDTDTRTRTPDTQRKSVLAFVVPAQHGAWSILLCSFVLGVGAIGEPNLHAPLLLVAVLAGFIAQHGMASFMRLSRRDDRRPKILIWSAGLLVPAGAILLFEVNFYERIWLLPLAGIAILMGAASIGIERARLDRTLAGELLGTLGLCLAVPAASYVTAGILDPDLFALWALALLFFFGSILYIRYLTRHRAAGARQVRERLRAGLLPMGFQAVGLAIASALALSGLGPLLAPLALVPGALKCVIGIGIRREKPPPILHIGLTELAHAILFVALGIGAFRI